MEIVDARRTGSLLVSGLVALTLSLRANSANASQPPLLPVGPYDWAPPTPASPPPDPTEAPTDSNYSVPPFVAPLPPAINYPPPITVPPATTPPVPCGPFGNECRDNPGPGRAVHLARASRCPRHRRASRRRIAASARRVRSPLGPRQRGSCRQTARNIAQGEYVTGSATFEVIADASGATQIKTEPKTEKCIAV